MIKVEIKVDDGNTYSYTTSETVIENPLGIAKAVLIEFSIYHSEDPETVMGKLYRSKEGNWFDMPGNHTINPFLKALIKKAIEQEERISNLAGYEGE